MEKIFENILLFLFHFQQLSIRLSSNRSTVSIIHYSLSKNTLNDIFLRQIEIKKNFMEEILLNKAMTSYSECSFQKIKCYLIPVIKLSSWKQFVERVSSSFVIELEDLSIIFEIILHRHYLIQRKEKSIHERRIQVGIISRTPVWNFVDFSSRNDYYD